MWCDGCTTDGLVVKTTVSRFFNSMLAAEMASPPSATTHLKGA
jgi:hypothetical protein